MGQEQRKGLWRGVRREREGLVSSRGVLEGRYGGVLVLGARLCGKLGNF